MRTLLVYKYYSCVLLHLRLNIAFTLSLDSCASQPHLVPRALRAWCTRLGLWSLSTSDPLELLQSSGYLVLDPSDSSRNSSHPCLALVPVTGPANGQQTGSQPACQTRHLIPPLAARSDSGRSSVRDTITIFPFWKYFSILTVDFFLERRCFDILAIKNIPRKGNVHQPSCNVSGPLFTLCSQAE